MSYLNHNFARKLAIRLLGSKGMWMGGGYLMQTEEEKQEAFCDKRS
jgi:hypothetical protein